MDNLNGFYIPNRYKKQQTMVFLYVGALWKQDVKADRNGENISLNNGCLAHLI